tara:strand:- start:8141 stop:9025 length:885 start_codon:yes stop_codon:yes gene_type:complete
MNYVSKIIDEQANVGEGPLWDEENQVLYWADIRSGRLFKYDPETNTNHTIYNGIYVGGFSKNSFGGLTLGTWNGVLLWESDRKKRWIHQGTYKGEKLQFNDCIAAPDGSFLAGTFYPYQIHGFEKYGKLYRFYPDGKIDIVSENHGCSNGMGFSPNLQYFYHSDPSKKSIVRHKYDDSTHEIGPAEDWFIHDEDGAPDGMTVDSEGYVWSALWGGSGVIKIDPDAKVVDKIDVDAYQTSSCMFGGKDLTDLYITSAATPDALANVQSGTYLGGSLFKAETNSVGKVEFETNFEF